MKIVLKLGVEIMIMYLLIAQVFNGLPFVEVKQWGTHSWENIDNIVAITFPIAFKSNLYNILALPTFSGTDISKALNVVSYGPLTTTKASLLYANIPSSVTEKRSFWIVIGK